MVYDEVVGVFDSQGSYFPCDGSPVGFFITAPEVQVPDDEVPGASEIQLVLGDTDAVSRCSLSGDGEVLCLATQVGLQLNRSSYAEYDCEIFRVLFECPAQRAFTIIIGIRDDDDLSSPASGCVFAKPFGSREGFQFFNFLIFSVGLIECVVPVRVNASTQKQCKAA